MGSKPSTVAPAQPTTKTYETKTADVICENKLVHNCTHLTRLIHALRSYDEYNLNPKQNKKNISDINITQILNIYLHFLHNHDDDEQFKYTNSKLNTCNILKCTGFRRNNRDQNNMLASHLNLDIFNKFLKKHDNDVEFNAILEILDKIHCYFSHSYDIGQRLTTEEKKMVNVDDEIKHQRNDELCDIDFTNNKMLKIGRILSNKHQKYADVAGVMSQRGKKKCTQLMSLKTGDKKFHFGYGFEYKYKGEHGINYNEVSQIYKSLKEELTNNKIAVITMEVFNSEYNKALKHLQTPFCKKWFPPFQEECTDSDYDSDHHNLDDYVRRLNNLEFDQVCGGDEITEFAIEHILALMIYCNHTNLQYEFSKTYRNDKIWHINGYQFKNVDHNQYFNLGKNLKIAVHKFGTPLQNSNVKIFYHGISEMLQFPKCIDIFGAVDVLCPLSTTSEFAVAANFAGLPGHGMIVEFTAGTDPTLTGNTKYFAVNRFSKYPGEKEYLFIQNQRKLIIDNILDVKTGYEYALILNALKTINVITYYQKEVLHIGLALEHLIVAIIRHQLSYASFKSLSEYGKEIVHRYFQRTNFVQFHYSCMKQSKWSILFEELCHVQYEWIRMRKIVELFPNNKLIKVKNIVLNESMFEDILRDLNDENIKISVKKIIIFASFQKDSEVAAFETKFKQSFKNIGYIIQAFDNVISIERFNIF